MVSDTRTYLAGDIGGTNARFALIDEHSQYHQAMTYAAADYNSLADAIRQYLSDTGSPIPSAAALAVATRVMDDDIDFTNNDNWSFSKAELAAELGIPNLQVVNDFTALALSVPHLKTSDLRQVGQGSVSLDHAIGIIGPGTGLGVSGLIPSTIANEWVPLHSEGGHCSASVATDREFGVFQIFRKRFNGHVSFERFLSGPGLVNVVMALRELDGLPEIQYSPQCVTTKGLDNSDPHCTEALEIFCGMLGMCAGDLALTLGASGGVYIGGGIVPKLGAFFEASTFRSRFENKGRMRDELLTIPTFVICDPYPALKGAAQVLSYT